MAKMDAERARREVWPWVIGAIALVILVAALVSLLGGDDEGVRVGEATPEAPAAAP